MLEVLAVLITGILAGLILKKYRGVIKWTEWLANISIYFLLFFLGVSVGVNKKIFQNLGSIGLLSLIITIFVVFGSVLTAYFVSKHILQIDNEK
ncbi:MAG: lysine exporter LysO family protein [Candidatus Mcinerneyibacterium aminivorans]|jgi:Kef-type K+ transport system membrane component KefB|uniref:Lysine exporter LysO family protein n=1 Tax=Candidatus Mcinerneyibacterium aminivorans TaxID=2703815 RepID=A0A5D0MIU7_9BACT|nr:MAG: lysine exporter LysO family protein [Candidatus Mcinerneyibacterium aminivorans]